MPPTLNPPMRPTGGLSPAAWLGEALQRQRELTLFALLMALALLPTFVAMGLDERLVRSVNVWVKPAKFMASLSLFALTTAWFFDLVQPAQRRAPALRFMVWSLIALASFEIAYIVLQSARGLASHYNFTSLFHVVMYQAMGAAALLLTATQLVLAWFIVRHARPGLHPAWRWAVVSGLVLTFVLGAGAGGVLGGMQPPAGPGLPAFGWKAVGDLRPAHFLGMHAQQILPLVGLAFLRWPPAVGRAAIIFFATLYVALWAAVLMMGLQGAVPTPIPGVPR
jgi:hypothetical protein